MPEITMPVNASSVSADRIMALADNILNIRCSAPVSRNNTISIMMPQMIK